MARGLQMERKRVWPRVAAAVSVALLLLAASPVQDVAFAEEPHWLLMAGAVGRPDYEGSDDTEAFPFGSFRVWWESGRYVELVGARSSGSAARLEANLLDTVHEINLVELGPVVQYRLARDDVDNNAVDALGDIDAALELGAFVALKFEDLRVRLTGAHDVSDEHDGDVVELAAEYRAKLSDTFTLTSGVASTWASKDYMKTYFGVTAAGAMASGLPEYSADSGVKDVGVRFTAMWAGPGQGWEHLRLIGLLSWFSMLGDAQDSPIVDDVGDDNQLFGGLAVGWEQ
jgi:outer membrane scaffolding protein for murein synthesis (MipA/OmpV family)